MFLSSEIQRISSSESIEHHNSKTQLNSEMKYRCRSPDSGVGANSVSIYIYIYNIYVCIF